MTPNTPDANERDELREKIATLSVEGHQLQNYLGSRHVDMLTDFMTEYTESVAKKQEAIMLSDIAYLYGKVLGLTGKYDDYISKRYPQLKGAKQ